MAIINVELLLLNKKKYDIKYNKSILTTKINERDSFL